MTGSNRSVLAFNLSYLFDRSDILQEVMVAVCERFEEGRSGAASHARAGGAISDVGNGTAAE